ncbi:Fic family protein [Nocardia ninae]|uniref:Fic family protein n=1 Tax=Nocardia ninae TaxID=356145 RepID=UPI001C98E5EB|nr:Fic family protein [Nocardia ninae]
MLNKFSSGSGTRLLRVMESAESTAVAPYLPWDKFRYKTPPDGLTVEEWWFANKMGRLSMRRRLPLYSVAGEPFAYALPDEVLRLLDEVAQRASGQIAAPEQVTNPATRDRYVVSSLIEEAIASSQLEGASTSRLDAKNMIRHGMRPKDRSEQMILNNYNAMIFVRENRNAEFTPEMVCELHRIVTEGTLDNPDSAGKLQNDPDPADRVKVFDAADNVLHVPPPVDQLPARLQALCDFANAKSDDKRYLPPVVRALAIHFMAGYDHYFEDGNGRTARALFYWSMLKQGYWLTEYLTISKILKKAPSKYSRSFIYTEQDDGDLTHFIIYQLQVLKRSMNELDDYLNRKVQEVQHARTLLSGSGEFNYRQLALLESAMRNSGNEFTVKSHSKSHGVSGQTARNDLYDLEKRGLLERFSIGRVYAWSPVPDLSETLNKAAPG